MRTDAVIGSGRGEDRQRSGVVDNLHDCFCFSFTGRYTKDFIPKIQSLSIQIATLLSSRLVEAMEYGSSSNTFMGDSVVMDCILFWIADASYSYYACETFRNIIISKRTVVCCDGFYRPVRLVRTESNIQEFLIPVAFPALG